MSAHDATPSVMETVYFWRKTGRLVDGVITILS
jgi:hypothetical protein